MTEGLSSMPAASWPCHYDDELPAEVAEGVLNCLATRELVQLATRHSALGACASERLECKATWIQRPSEALGAPKNWEAIRGSHRAAEDAPFIEEGISLGTESLSPAGHPIRVSDVVSSDAHIVIVKSGEKPLEPQVEVLERASGRTKYILGLPEAMAKGKAEVLGEKAIIYGSSAKSAVILDLETGSLRKTYLGDRRSNRSGNAIAYWSEGSRKLEIFDIETERVVNQLDLPDGWDHVADLQLSEGWLVAVRDRPVRHYVEYFISSTKPIAAYNRTSDPASPTIHEIENLLDFALSGDHLAYERPYLFETEDSQGERYLHRKVHIDLIDLQRNATTHLFEMSTDPRPAGYDLNLNFFEYWRFEGSKVIAVTNEPSILEWVLESKAPREPLFTKKKGIDDHFSFKRDRCPMDGSGLACAYDADVVIRGLSDGSTHQELCAPHPVTRIRCHNGVLFAGLANGQVHAWPPQEDHATTEESTTATPIPETSEPSDASDHSTTASVSRKVKECSDTRHQSATTTPIPKKKKHSVDGNNATASLIPKASEPSDASDHSTTTSVNREVEERSNTSYKSTTATPIAKKKKLSVDDNKQSLQPLLFTLTVSLALVVSAVALKQLIKSRIASAA